MDADNVILLAQCLSNRARPVCKFAIGYLGQDRGQRSWSAKCANYVIFHAIIAFNLKKDQACANFNVNLYLCLVCLQIGYCLLE